MSLPQEYTPKEWDKLQSAVEKSGGALLPDPCEGQTLSYPKAGGEPSLARTCECGRQSMMVVIYEPDTSQVEARKMRERGGGFARVCGYCDFVGGWPKFNDVLGS